MAGPINGTNLPQLQPVTYGRNQSGNYQRQQWRGMDAGASGIAALANTFAWTGVIDDSTPQLMYEYRQKFGGIAELDVEYPYSVEDETTDFIQIWELHANRGEKDILDCVDNNGLIASLSQNFKSIIRYYIYQNIPDGTTNNPFPTLATFAAVDGSVASPSTAATNAFLIYKLMVSGMQSYLMPAPILRATTTTSLAWSTGYSLSNVGKLEKMSTVSAYGLPTTLLTNLTSYIAAYTTTDPNLVYAWYKDFPTMQEIAKCKWSITQEWMFGWWPSALYGDPI